MSDKWLIVNLLVNNENVNVPYTWRTTAEDVCFIVCKKLNIGPVSRHLFALRIKGDDLFLAPSATFGEKNPIYELRIRFKPANLEKLKKQYLYAYNYYFHQVRLDLLENKVPGIVFEKCRRELVGLGVTDMYRVMVEEEVSSETIQSEYRKYMPKEVLKRHSFFVKKPVKDTLEMLKRAGHSALFVKSQYLKQFNNIAPEYLSEEYKAYSEVDGVKSRVVVKVSPYHSTQSGIRFSLESKKDNEWQHVCTIEDLCHVSVREEYIEINRKNGIPFTLQISHPLVLSFVSLLDGYYRLTCKWTFNLCTDVFTPSLKKLFSLRCHGPVGVQFSYHKLEEKRSNCRGCYILRECENNYDVYYIDVFVVNSSKPKTYKVEKLPNDEYKFEGKIYKTIKELIKDHNDPNKNIYLKECLPPSEYDNSPLLLCNPDTLVGDSLTNSSSLNNLLPGGGSCPLCINSRDIQVYKANKQEDSDGKITVYKSLWVFTKGKKIEVAMKVLKSECCEEYLKEFLELGNQWAFLNSSSIVKMFGVTLMSPVSMVFEHMTLGKLDEYLKKNESNIQKVDLVEAATNLASALWYLEEKGIVHGRIRCKKLLVSSHNENSFVVKLSDPGLKSTYETYEIHWIPVECYPNLEYAKISSAADVWAFATTLWEIFMFGDDAISKADHFRFMKLYASGKRLPQPSSCPNDIYQVMKSSWETDPHHRLQSQEILRDIKQVFYQVYNSRKHNYTVPKLKDKDSSACRSTSSLNTITTDTTYVFNEDGLVSVESSVNNENDSVYSSDTDVLENAWFMENRDDENNLDIFASTFISNFNYSSVDTLSTSLNSFNSMQSVLELDGKDVILQPRILGEGNYGIVYEGTLQLSYDFVKKVAVKKLKSAGATCCYMRDFEREINIMKELDQENIVQIFGILQEPDIAIVMEFVEGGSLPCYLEMYRERLSRCKLLHFCLDISKGMKYLGEKRIVHRDLAARNILVVDEDHVKISDFGLAQCLGASDYYILKSSRELPIKWYAPESLRDGKFSTRSDVWSFGVTMCEIFSYGEVPNLVNVTDAPVDQEGFLSSLERGERFPCPRECPLGIFNNVIYPCWTSNPHDRPTFSHLCTIIQSALFQEYN